jgi:predicted RNA binding protein YcfA (HicA-like mRNA interferase family)
LDSREVIRALEQAGFRHLRTRGSHVILSRPGGRGIVVVPHPRRDLPIGTIRAIERQAGIRVRR